MNRFASGIGKSMLYNSPSSRRCCSRLVAPPEDNAAVAAEVNLARKPPLPALDRSFAAAAAPDEPDMEVLSADGVNFCTPASRLAGKESGMMGLGELMLLDAACNDELLLLVSSGAKEGIFKLVTGSPADGYRRCMLCGPI